MKKSCIRYYGGKLLAFVVSVLVLSVLVFYIARLAPGRPARVVLRRPGREDERRRARLGGGKVGLSDPDLCAVRPVACGRAARGVRHLL